MINTAPSGCPTTHECSSSSDVSAGLVSFDVGRAPTYCSIVSCSFSVLGSLLIFLTYFLLKDIRNTAQKIITLLAVADLFTASGYLLAGWNFLTHFEETDSSKCLNVFQPVCAIQSYITTWSSLCSFSWTCALALHFYLVLSPSKKHLPPKILVYENIVAWVVPIIIVFPLLCAGKLGYTQYASSNWCFIKDAEIYGTNEHTSSTYNPRGSNSSARGDGGQGMAWKTVTLMFVAGKFWEILSYVFVVVMYWLTRRKFHKQLDQRREISSTVNSPQSPYVKEMRSEVKQRLLLIPIVFILLRMWGTIQFFYSLAASSQNHNGCIPPLSRRVFLALAIVQAIGDGGQGWGNAVLYIFLSPVIRQELFCWSFFKCIQYIGKKMRTIGEKMETAGDTEHRDDRIVEQETHPPSGSGRTKRPFGRHGSIKKPLHTSSQAGSTDVDFAHTAPPIDQPTSAPLLAQKDSLPRRIIEEESIEIRSRDSLSSAAARRQHMHSNEYVHV